MGMVAQYFRLTPEELQHALQDPEWAEDFTNDILDAELNEELEDGRETSGFRGYDTDKVWDALRILLHRSASVDPCPFLGGTAFADVWSYDKPRALTSDEVSGLAERLSSVPFDRLVDAYDAPSLAQAYLGPWSRDDVEGLREQYDGLVKHFRAAAAAGEAMIVYLA